MEDKLENFNEGDNVILWCIGTRTWDDVTVTIKSKFGVLIDLEYPSGRIARFSPDAWAKKIKVSSH